MREVEVFVPSDKAQIVETVLTEAGIEYSKIEGETNINLVIATTTEEVEHIINELSKIGVGKSFGRIHVSSLEVVLPAKKLTEEVAQRISTQELLSSIVQPAQLTQNFIVYAVLSAILAALGLIGDNVVIIIASMLISPLMGPIMGISLGIVMFDRRLIKNGVIAGIIGFFVSIGAGVVFAVATPYFTLTPEIMLRSSPTVEELGLAVISGLALSISTVSKETSILVGVAIAAALVPPAANIGIGLGSFNFDIALGSTLLLGINIISILIVSVLTLWLKGIKPKESVRREKMAVKKIRSRLGVLIIAFIVFSIPLVYSSLNIYQRSSLQNQANQITTQIFRNYPDAILLDVESTYYTIDPYFNNQTIRIFIIALSQNETYLINVPKIIADQVYAQTGIFTVVSLQIEHMSFSG
ncbi:MAG: TIGR00341 family protein [Candidatus Odinarchaeia archaeon]